MAQAVKSELHIEGESVIPGPGLGTGRPATTSSGTVFVVDDDLNSRNSILRLVSTMGVPSRAFSSAEEFLAEFQSHPPSGCIVSDIRLSGISGLELQRRLRARQSPLPIVFLTGFADVRLAVQVMQAGAVTLLEKPCRQQELWDAIRTALDRDARRCQRLAKTRAIQQRLELLTPGEKQILDLVLEGLSNKLIAQQLSVSLRSVEKGRGEVFRKMKADSLPDLVRMIVESTRSDEN